ncbi:hypothetical protein ACN20G_11805 [Streptomyces sp. BI20]|uniref:hypothetical protein n=1 Tax=Streptomyces sp. BI20 TaxID=3403460 RepID=UPI003C756F73
MQSINSIIEYASEGPYEASLIGLAIAVLGPPIVQRIGQLTVAFWGPKVRKLRRVVADRVAPKDPEPPAEPGAELAERF